MMWAGSICPGPGEPELGVLWWSAHANLTLQRPHLTSAGSPDGVRWCVQLCTVGECVGDERKKERNKEVSWRLPLYVLEKPEVSASSQITRLWCAVSSGGFRHYAKTSQSYHTIWSRFLSQGRRISAWWIFIWAEGWAKSLLLLLVAARQWHNCIWRYFHLDSRLHAVCCQPPGAKLVSLSLCISVNPLSLCSERETHHWCGTINDHSSRPNSLWYHLCSKT